MGSMMEGRVLNARINREASRFGRDEQHNE
jgi:hypothetical protein